MLPIFICYHMYPYQAIDGPVFNIDTPIFKEQTEPVDLTIRTHPFDDYTSINFSVQEKYRRQCKSR